MGGLTENKLNNPALVESLKSLGFQPEDPEGMTFEEAMEAAQISSAVRGNLKSYQAVMESIKKKKRMPLAEFLEANNGK